jgi:hypothetical protein
MLGVYNPIWSETVFKLKESKTVVLTRAFAHTVNSKTPAPGDRPYRPALLKSLLAEMESSKFRPPEWAWAICEANDIIYRVDGKHTSKLLAEWPKDRELPVNRVHVSVFLCKDIQEVSELYSTFNSRESGRRIPDINRAFQGACFLLRDQPSWLVNVSIAGLALARWELDTKKIKPVTKAQLLLEYPDFVLWARTILEKSGTSKGKLTRAAVVGAMARTYQRNKNKAHDFWTAVRDGSDPDPRAPSRVLQLYLIQLVMRNRTYDATKKQEKITDHMVMSKCMHGWNAYRKGTYTELRYKSTDKIPEAI